MKGVVRKKALRKRIPTKSGSQSAEPKEIAIFAECIEYRAVVNVHYCHQFKKRS
ncbi:MAG: hypothetical protein K8I01_08745 [Candidatus Methylomirabilis sp.]|nr:hypothetical protein [Deltaproteobacteria bacterium]